MRIQRACAINQSIMRDVITFINLAQIKRHIVADYKYGGRRRTKLKWFVQKEFSTDQERPTRVDQ